MEFRILGPLEAIDGGNKLHLGGPRQRLVLAYLLLEANRVVPTDRLIDGIWGDEPPDAARSALFAYISRLRKLLGPSRIQARPPGYVLNATADEVDALRFAELVAQAKARLDPAAIAAGLADALSLWRGDPLADLADHDALRPQIGRLEEQRLDAQQEHADALLAAGEQRRALPLLEALVAEHPLRERLWMSLMLALYRSGRQSEALANFHRVRKLLADELGIDPSPELRQLHEQMLQQDGTLDAPRQARPVPDSDRTAAKSRAPQRTAMAAGIAAFVTIGALVLAAVVLSRPRPVIRADTVLQIDPASAAVINAIAVGRKPDALTFDGTNIWVANFDDRTIQAINVSSGQAAPAVGGFDGNPVALSSGSGSIWVGLGFPIGQVMRVDPSTNNTISAATGPSSGLDALSFREGTLWVTNGEQDSLTRIGPASGTVARVDLPGAGPGGLSVSTGAVWVAEPLKRAVVEIESASLQVTRTVQIASGIPDQVCVGEGYVWVTDTKGRSVTKVDPNTNGLATTIESVGNWPSGLAVGNGKVWVANSLGPTVAWIDAKTDAVEGEVSLPAGTRPVAVLFAANYVWVTVQAG